MHYFKTKKEIREHLVNLTKELVRFPSHQGEPRQIFALVDFIKDYFKTDGLDIDEHNFDGLPALFITNKGTRHPEVLLSGHIDIVDTAASYVAEVDGDKLRGASTMDMKGGVACMMACMKYFAQMGADAPSVGLVLTADEETAGDSILRLIRDESYCANFCIINEGRSKYDIVVREKGVFAVQVNLDGRDTHSAYPWKAENALEEIMSAFMRIKEDFPPAKNAWQPSASITSLHGGHMLNVIPGCAEAIFSFRLTEEKWTKENLLKRIQKELPRAELKELAEGDVYITDSNNQYVQLLQEIARKHSKEKVQFAMNHGASEARFISNLGITTAVLGPVGDEHHSVDEWVSIKSLVWHFEVLREFITREHAQKEQMKADLKKGL